jgi:hypothetical protein
MASLDLLAHPHISIPYVHIGFIMDLYSNSLFSNDRGEILRYKTTLNRNSNKCSSAGSGRRYEIRRFTTCRKPLKKTWFLKIIVFVYDNIIINYNPRH